MENLEMEQLENIDGGKGFGRAIEAFGGSIGLANATALAVIPGGGVILAGGIAVGSAIALIDACS